MFRLIETSSGQIQTIVLVHSVGAHSLNVPVCMVCIWPDDGSMSRNMSPNF